MFQLAEKFAQLPAAGGSQLARALAQFSTSLLSWTEVAPSADRPAARSQSRRTAARMAPAEFAPPVRELPASFTSALAFGQKLQTAAASPQKLERLAERQAQDLAEINRDGVRIRNPEALQATFS